jgi:hypothetical protein
VGGARYRGMDVAVGCLHARIADIGWLHFLSGQEPAESDGRT